MATEPHKCVESCSPSPSAGEPEAEGEQPKKKKARVLTPEQELLLKFGSKGGKKDPSQDAARLPEHIARQIEVQKRKGKQGGTDSYTYSKANRRASGALAAQAEISGLFAAAKREE
eukprot:RCo023448